jgi:hypothetical protein
MARGGEVFRNLRNPQVARDAKSGAVVVTLNGEEDEFVVLQMPGSIADELAEALAAALAAGGIYVRGVK